MIHVRVVVPGDRREAVLAVLDECVGVCHVAVFPAAVRRPDADLVLFDVPPEAADEALAALDRAGVRRFGAITVEHAELALSRSVDAARRAAPGDHSDAIVWAEVDQQVLNDARPSLSYLVYFALASMIAAAGILTDSPILIVGAMVVGPDYGPLAAVSYGVEQRRWRLAGRGLATLATGAFVGLLAAAIATLGARLFGQIPDLYLRDERPFTRFISHPDFFSFAVAVAAGVAGVFALTHSRSGTLVGVFISVTTIPAIAEIGVAAVMTRGADAAGAALQLAINLVTLVVVGVATLVVLRRLSNRDRGRRTPVR